MTLVNVYESIETLRGSVGACGITFRRTPSKTEQGAMSFKFVIPTKTGGPAPPLEYLPKDAKKRFVDGSGGLRGRLPGHCSFVEVIADRYFYMLNGCEYHEETFLPMLLRPIGWGLRMALFLFSIVFVILANVKEHQVIGQYGFSRERDAEGVLVNSNEDAFEWFVYLIYGLWVVSLTSETFSYLLGRGGGGRKAHAGQCSAFPLTLFNRVSIGGSEDDDGGQCFQATLLLVWWIGLTVTTSILLHTVISAMFVTRNVWFAWLFVALLTAEILGGLSDALSLGGIDGLAVENRPASWLAAFRVVIILPILLIFSLFFLWLCSPPWTIV